MRLFTGIALPEDVLARITRLIDLLRPAAQFSWTPPYNLHITTKFIGELPESRLPDLQQALAGLPERTPVPVRIRAVGWLPNPHAPRILFAGIEREPALVTLARDTEDAVASLGIARETREYRPHLTLARIRTPGTSLAAIRRIIADLDSDEFGSFDAGSFQLYLSRPGPAGSVYTQLSEFPFQNK